MLKFEFANNKIENIFSAKIDVRFFKINKPEKGFELAG
jgi:hypothetical protein